MGVVWATCATLPFLETFVFDAHVDSGRSRLSADDYIRMGLLFLLLWASMCFVFLIDKDHVHRIWSKIKHDLKSWRHKLREYRTEAIILLILMVLSYVFVGRQELVELVRSEIGGYVRRALLLLTGGVLIWLVAKFVQSLGHSLPAGMREGIDNWALSFRVGILFYAFLVGGTLLLVNFRGVSPAVSLTMQLTLIKDYILLFMISGLLYGGLFKLARAHALLDVFQNRQGFLHFVIICAMIAVFAVWADYRELDPVRLERLFSNEWQRQYMQFHVFVRDIVLLLLPIGFLLFWTLDCVADEFLKRQQKPS